MVYWSNCSKWCYELYLAALHVDYLGHSIVLRTIIIWHRFFSKRSKISKYAIHMEIILWKFRSDLCFDMCSSYQGIYKSSKVQLHMMMPPKGNVSAILALCDGNPPVTGELPSQRPVMWSFHVFFDLHQKNGWENSRYAGDLRRHRAHYCVTVMRRYMLYSEFLTHNTYRRTSADFELVWKNICQMTRYWQRLVMLSQIILLIIRHISYEIHSLMVLCIGSCTT